MSCRYLIYHREVMRNDSANDLELLDAANLHCEIHYLLLSIPHTNLTIYTLKTDLKK
jgi:hypothetical protein